MKISIITVAYNSSDTILETIYSVKQQSYKNFEHLIIDGGSNDGTVDILKKTNYPCMKFISEPDGGIYDAMNKGINLAMGEIVGFLNSDDTFNDSDVLIKIVNAFEDPSVMVCFADLFYVNGDNSRILRYWKSNPYKRGMFAKGWIPAHPTFYIRRSALAQAGFFDLRYRLAADAEFMMRCLDREGFKSIYIPHVLVNMRVGGATNKNWSNIWLQNIEVLHALRKNNIPYSLFSFWILKVLNRIMQRVNARFYECS